MSKGSVSSIYLQHIKVIILYTLYFTLSLTQYSFSLTKYSEHFIAAGVIATCYIMNYDNLLWHLEEQNAWNGKKSLPVCSVQLTPRVI